MDKLITEIFDSDVIIIKTDNLSISSWYLKISDFLKENPEGFDYTVYYEIDDPAEFYRRFIVDLYIEHGIPGPTYMYELYRQMKETGKAVVYSHWLNCEDYPGDYTAMPFLGEAFGKNQKYNLEAYIAEFEHDNQFHVYVRPDANFEE